MKRTKPKVHMNIHLIISVTGWIFKPCLLGYVVSILNEDSESVLGLGQFGHFPVFWYVKSFGIRNHFFSWKQIYIKFDQIKFFLSKKHFEIVFKFILSIQNNSMVPQFWISKPLKYAIYWFIGLMLYIKMKLQKWILWCKCQIPQKAFGFSRIIEFR